MLVTRLPAGAPAALSALCCWKVVDSRTYERLTGVTLARSAFYKRLKPGVASLLQFLVGVAFRILAESQRGIPAGILSHFKELLAVDASVLNLHRLLEGAFPACRTNCTKAAAKLHMLMNVQDGTPRRVQLSPERGDERGPWRKLGPWIKGARLLFDLGYFAYFLFNRIDRMGGYFLSRLKKNANPLIIKSHRSHLGRSINVEGKRLLDVLPLLKRGVLDVEVEVAFEYRAFGRRRESLQRNFRLVAVLNAETKEYHCYITNVPPDMIQAQDITRVYALRWQVELLFKAMKSHGHLDHLPSSKQHIVECLIWASVLSLILSRALFLLIRRALPADRFVPMLRWAAIFGQFAYDLLRLLLQPDAGLADTLLQVLLRQAPDPNRNRRDRALDGLVAWDAA